MVDSISPPEIEDARVGILPVYDADPDVDDSAIKIGQAKSKVEADRLLREESGKDMGARVETRELPHSEELENVSVRVWIPDI